MLSPTQIISILLLLLLTRLYLVTRKAPKVSKWCDSDTCSLAVFLGSGGHTGEALMLISALDFSRYSPRTYIVTEGDPLSAQKALALEDVKAAADDRPRERQMYRLQTIPRARRVHQSLLSTPPTALISFLACVYLITFSPLVENGSLRKPYANLLILNGPGTCVSLCAAVMLNKLIGLPSPKMIYVESFARVQTLSLSGRILRHLVDRFVVQWPDLVRAAGYGDCHGCLV
ncbi:glycosyltransferase family 1 protein [Phlebopus sp. FC_14]|nr:glycosyltransferase family 1 protein [Phlebopus sp. FC_14]